MESDIQRFKYEYLNRVRITLHADQQSQLSKTTLDEIHKFIDFEFYSQEKMKLISGEGRIQDELNRLIQRLLEIRRDQPDGSNQECMCMDQITEFIGKLDLEDFRKIRIDRLIESAE
ncbi:MAG: hypothetical protein HQ517_14485 [SAR324 cluster bacterium]|nr:hypothetical protein [SAR324 cluster bacterium]